MNSTAIQPTALYQFSGTQLQQLINEIVSSIKVETSTTPLFAEISSRQVCQHLCSKGYRAKSPLAVKKVLADHNIKPTQRGREYWYSSEQVFNIPSKTSI